LGLFLVGCANKTILIVREKGVYKDYAYKIPFDLSADKKQEVLARHGVIYVGMPKEDLKKYGFGNEQLLDYYCKGSKEYFVFSESEVGPEKGDITFIVEGGEVKDWMKVNTRR